MGKVPAVGPRYRVHSGLGIRSWLNTHLSLHKMDSLIAEQIQSSIADNGSAEASGHLFNLAEFDSILGDPMATGPMGFPASYGQMNFPTKPTGNSVSMAPVMNKR